MASYKNAYNQALANQQRRLDIANVKNDWNQSLRQPLQGGGMSGGDFWSDFADGFMSVWNPIIDTAGKVAPLLPLVGLGESGGDMSVNAPYEGYVYGSGYSGGAIPNDGIPPFNKITNAGMSGGCDCGCRSRMCGCALSGGDEISDTDHPIIRNPELQATMFLGGRKPSSVSKKEKIGMVQQVIADMILKNKMKGRGLSGGDFWSDLGDTFTKVAPFLPLLGLGASGGAGASGGKRLMEKKYADMLLKKQLKKLHGKGLSGGDFDWSSLLSFAPLLLGLGMSGGKVDMSELDEFEPFLTGLGLSGGDFWDDLSKGFSDAWSWITDTAIPAITPVIDTAGKVADVYGKVSGKKEGKGYSGGAMTYEQNMNMADAMGDIFSGMGKGSDTRKKSGAIQLYKGGNSEALMLQQKRSNVNQPYLTGNGKARKTKMNERLAEKIAKLQGRGMEPIGDMEASNDIVGLMSKTNPEVDRKIGSGVSGGKRSSKWIDHVKAYAKQHGIKYGEALKKAKATYRG